MLEKRYSTRKGPGSTPLRRGRVAYTGMCLSIKHNGHVRIQNELEEPGIFCSLRPQYKRISNTSDMRVSKLPDRPTHPVSSPQTICGRSGLQAPRLRCNRTRSSRTSPDRDDAGQKTRCNRKSRRARSDATSPDQVPAPRGVGRRAKSSGGRLPESLQRHGILASPIRLPPKARIPRTDRAAPMRSCRRRHDSMGSRHSRGVSEIPAPLDAGTKRCASRAKSRVEPVPDTIDEASPGSCHAKADFVGQALYALYAPPIADSQAGNARLAARCPSRLSGSLRDPQNADHFRSGGKRESKSDRKHALSGKAARPATAWTIMEQRMAPEKTCSVFNGSRESRFLENGAVDGTRTRDPRRDRPVL